MYLRYWWGPAIRILLGSNNRKHAETDIHTHQPPLLPRGRGGVLPGRASRSLWDGDGRETLSAWAARWITADQPKHENDRKLSWDRASITANNITALSLRITLRVHGHLQQPNWPQEQGNEWLFWTRGGGVETPPISCIRQESTLCPSPAVDGPILGSKLRVQPEMRPAILGHQGEETFSGILHIMSTRSGSDFSLPYLLLLFVFRFHLFIYF